MPSGQYTIDDSSRGRGDTSFRACVIALLIFLLFCVTIIIVLLVVKKDTGSGTTAKSEDGSASKHTGDEPGKEDRRDSEGASEGTTHAGPSSTPPPLAPAGKATEETTTKKTASRDSSEDRSSSETKHVKASTEYPSSTEHSASIEPRRGLVGVDDTTDYTGTSTEFSMAVLTGSTVLPEMPRSIENATTTSTERSFRSTTGVSAESAESATTDVSASETHSIDTSGNLTSTSTEPPTSTSTASLGLRRSLEESAERTASTSTEHSSRTEVPPIIPTSPPPPVPCTSSECKKLGATILATMGLDADPCKQFYEYACGGLRENKYLLEPEYDEEAWHRINGMVDKINPSSPESYKKFNTLIQSCKTYDPVKDIHTWKDAVNKEMKDLGDIALEDAGYSQNFTRLFLGLLQHDRICSLNNDIGRTNAYEVAKEALLSLGIFSAIDEAGKLNETILNYVDFLVLNNEVLGEKAARRVELLNRDPELKTVAEVNEMFVEGVTVDMSAIIEKLIGRPLNEDERVQVYSAGYFKTLNDKYKLRFKKVLNCTGALESRYHVWTIKVYLISPRDLHKARCWWRFAAARYRDPGGSSAGGRAVLACTARAWAPLLARRRAALLHILARRAARSCEAQAGNFLFEVTNNSAGAGHAPWLRGAAEALRKTSSSKMESIKIANITDHTRDVMDTLKLDAALNDYPIDGEGFVKNAIMLMVRNRKPIPLGAMEKPFYDPDYLRHIRLAGLGFSVAHEMAHHIDSLGIKFNTSIDEHTRSDYKEKVPHFLVWESEVNVEYMNMTGPSKHKIVHFKKKETKTDIVLPYLPLTNDQSFFVFLAQKFCTKLDYFSMVLDFFESPFFPPETRVKNMLKNNAAFYKAFNCKSTNMTDYPFPYIEVPYDDVTGDSTKILLMEYTYHRRKYLFDMKNKFLPPIEIIGIFFVLINIIIYYDYFRKCNRSINPKINLSFFSIFSSFEKYSFSPVYNCPRCLLFFHPSLAIPHMRRFQHLTTYLSSGIILKKYFQNNNHLY
ncbi:Endothelin-converting enzyme-like 1, partial [Gryllus bimaculatus]